MHYTCLIAFYNEDENLLSILQNLKNVPKITQIICVDDGSENELSSKVTKQFPKVELLKNATNKGKSDAVLGVLDKVYNENLILLDADLIKLSYQEINAALNIHESRFLDMLILENRGDNYFVDSLLRKTITQSGKRVLKKKNLLEVSRLKPKAYELEVAINKYMLDHNKKVGWMKSYSYNPHKKKKLGLIEGFIKDNEMTIGIIKYLGLRDYIKQLLFFSRAEVI